MTCFCYKFYTVCEIYPVHHSFLWLLYTAGGQAANEPGAAARGGSGIAGGYIVPPRRGGRAEFKTQCISVLPARQKPAGRRCARGIVCRSHYE